MWCLVTFVTRQGVPLRIEIGPKDVQASQVTVVRRDNGAKTTVRLLDVPTVIPELLTQIQSDMLARARRERDEHLSVITEYVCDRVCRYCCCDRRRIHASVGCVSLCCFSVDVIELCTCRLGQQVA